MIGNRVVPELKDLTLLFVLSALAVTPIALVFAHLFPNCNAQLAAFLGLVHLSPIDVRGLSTGKGLPGISGIPRIPGIPGISIWLNALLVFAVSTGAAFAGNLSIIPRLICCFQLLVVSVFVQWIFLQAALPPLPVAFFLAIVLSCSAGYLLRFKRLSGNKQQAQSSELALRKHELLEARLQMVKQDEVDRRLLAGDLHDQVLNDLKVLNQQFHTYKKEPNEDLAEQIDKLLQQSMNGVRDVMDSLSPAILEHVGFSAALEDCLKRASERGTGFKVRFKTDSPGDDFSDLDLIEQTLLYRLVQECGTNICKHAGATLVRVSLERSSDALVIRVLDNGKGIPASVDTMGSRGFQYMRQRADLIGATIAWSSDEKGKGTLVEICMPVKRRTV
jgi:signal transduction histidine kinase